MLTNEMKEWLSQGEWDIDAMIRYGIFTEEYCLMLCRILIDSPWREKGTP